MAQSFDPNAGGVQRTTFKLGKYFTEQGLEVRYYSAAHTGHVHVEYGDLVHASQEGGVENTHNIVEMLQFLKEFQPDIVINQVPYERSLREPLAQQKEEVGYLLLGCLRNSLFNFKNNARDRMRQMLPKSVLTMMDNALGEALVQIRHWYIHRRELKAIIDEHDYFVLLAPPNRKELSYFVGEYKSEKVIAIPNSIPQVVNQLPAKEKTILHVGRINIQQKRSDLLLEFWEKVYAQLPDWNFVIVGDGPYFDELQADLKRRNLPRVKLEGFQKPDPYYEKAAIYMMPSAYEGFPNTLLEAQSYGCVPVVFDSYAALSWIVNDGQDALLSPPFQVSHMAQNAIKLAGDDKTRHSMQSQAQRNATRFTIDKVGQKWFELFEALQDDQ